MKDFGGGEGGPVLYTVWLVETRGEEALEVVDKSVKEARPLRLVDGKGRSILRLRASRVFVRERSWREGLGVLTRRWAG